MHRHSRIESLLVFLGGRMQWTLNAKSKVFGWLDVGRMFHVGPDDDHGAVTTGQFGLFANWETWRGDKSSAACDLQLA